MRNKSIHALVAIAAFGVAGSAIAAMPAMSNMLTGAQEVPAVDTKAMGTNKIMIKPDGSVSGVVETTGIAGTAAHIHLAPKGSSGPPIITLEKTSDNMWSVPANSHLTPEQLQAYKDGGLYVNVHSAEHKGGEIRLQLAP